jgi:pimeloyl-ACP methyl ester carboxylesterase
LLFAHPPRSVPREWLAEQCRLALSPGYLEAHLTTLRAQVGPGGQRKVLLDRLPLLQMPTLVVWGRRDRVFPQSQAREAVARLRKGSLSLIPDCGYMPHVECPAPFVATLKGSSLLVRVNHRYRPGESEDLPRIHARKPK